MESGFRRVSEWRPNGKCPFEEVMADKEQGDWIDRHGGHRLFATRCFANHIKLVVLISVLCPAASPPTHADDSQAAKGISRQINLDGPGKAGAMPREVVQVLDSKGNPSRYFMDVDSVVCADAMCEIVTVRIYFDALGNYERYELPSGGNLTKYGHKPFSPADHSKLHRVLSDPYSPLKSIRWDEITTPNSSAVASDDVDGSSGATILSKRNVVVVGAAYTCCTLSIMVLFM